jgi:hypothetical protein
LLKKEKPKNQTEIKTFFASSGSDDLSSHRHRQAIGWLGLSLPWALWLFNGFRPTPEMDVWNNWDSISAYYFSGGNAVFCGVLFALTVFLLTYRGYDNDSQKWDLIFGVIAGIASFCVAFFPTEPPYTRDHVPLQTPAWWNVSLGTGPIHLWAASILFLSFIVFSLFLFTKSKEPKGFRERLEKPRDRVYVVCGVLMIIFVVWAFFRHRAGQSIFWQESFSLEAFGVSWLTKSRVDDSYRYAVKWVRGKIKS